jgi:hypothetical protein
MFFVTIHHNPCDKNRGKIDDFIAILEAINCALYRDRSRFRQKAVFNRDKIVQTDDFFGDENTVTKSDRILIK